MSLKQKALEPGNTFVCEIIRSYIKRLIRSFVISVRNMHKPVKWDQLLTSSGPTVAAETKKISDIKNLNPFMNKVTLPNVVVCLYSLIVSTVRPLCSPKSPLSHAEKEFLVTVKIGKIDKSWWYNACKKCLKTAKIHGDSYKCTEPECGLIGMPTQRSSDVYCLLLVLCCKILLKLI
jgi:replication factor A1